MSDTKIDAMTQHGAFSWNELMTTDVDGAKAFYSEMFNWKLQDLDMDEPYTIGNINEEGVAGIMPIPPGNAGMPPMWGAYITVDDVDKSVQQAVTLGGKIFMEPRDIPELGRFAVIADPQGAVISMITYIK